MKSGRSSDPAPSATGKGGSWSAPAQCGVRRRFRASIVGVLPADGYPAGRCSGLAAGWCIVPRHPGRAMAEGPCRWLRPTVACGVWC